MSVPGPSDATEPVSFFHSLLILLVGDLAVLLVFLGLVSRGRWTGGLMLLIGSAVPFLAVALLRPHLCRFAVRGFRGFRGVRGVRGVSLDSTAMGLATGIGAAIVALGLTFGSVGTAGVDTRVRAQLGPIDELVEVPPSVSFTSAGNAVMEALSKSDLRLLIDADPLTIARTSGALTRPATDAVAVQLLELDTERAMHFGGVRSDTGFGGATIAPGHAVITRDLAAVMNLRTGSVLPSPFGFIVDGVVKRVGIAGLGTPDGAIVPNIIVGPGTLNRLVASGWTAPVHTGFALSNAGGVVDSRALSARLTEGVRQSLAATDAQGGTELVFGDEPVATGLDRVVVQPMKAMLYRAESARVNRVAANLRLESWLAVLTGGSLVSLTVALSVAVRRKEAGTLRTAGLSGSAGAAVISMSIWLDGLLALVAGAAMGAVLGWVIGPATITHVFSALTFSIGAMGVVTTLVGGALTMVWSRTPVLGHRRIPVLLGAAALVLAIIAWRTHDSAILLVAVTTAVVAISWLFSRRSVMAALVPLGWASAGAFGPFASSVPVGVIGLAVSLAGTVVAVLSVADAWGARWASAGLMTRLSFGPFEKADIGAVGLMVAVIVVVAGGTSGALVRARSPLSLGNSRTITVESPDNSIGVHDISDVLKDNVAVAELGVLPVDLGPPFTGVTLIGATPDWISQAPMLMSGKPWVDVLSNPGSAVVSSDLLASPELTGKKVGDIVTLRDRTTGRLLPVVMAGVVDGSVAASTVWTNRATLTDVAAGGRVPVRFVLQPPHTKQVAVAIRQALGGRSVVVTTAAEAAGAARWSTARHIHDAGGHIVGGMWILGALGVAVTAFRRAWRRMEELQSLRSVGAHRAIVGAVRRELLGLTGTGVVCGFLLGGIHAQLVTKAAGARWGTWQRALGDVVSGSALIVLTAAVVVMWTTRGARQRGGTRPARRTLRP